MKIEVSNTADPDDASAVANGLVEHAASMCSEPRNAEKLFVTLHDTHGKLIAGMYANTVWGWLHIKQLWVSAEARGAGIGKRLMTAAETEAIRRGCHHAMLDTFDFQARPFYEKLGYSVFGTLNDFPWRHERYFMSKQLTATNALAPASDI